MEGSADKTYENAQAINCKPPENKTKNNLEMKTGDFMEGNSVLHQELT